jgi:hypothetical protein
MKIAILLFSLISFAGNDNPTETKDPLFYNKKIVQFVESNMGKQVYEGEAVDLPLEALKAVGAKRDFPNETIFGQEINTRRQDIEPGDLLQFDKAEFENRKTKTGWKFDNHSAVVLSVEKNNVLKFAAQNLFQKKFVTIHELELDTLKRGQFKVYRAMAPGPGTAGASAAGTK